MNPLRRHASSQNSSPRMVPIEALLASGPASEGDARPHRFWLFWSQLADEAARILAAPLDRLAPGRRWVLGDTGNGFEVHKVRGRHVERMGGIADGAAGQDAPWLRDLRAADQVELRIEPALVVRQTLSLPAESAPFADAVVQHRLERLTPWRVGDVVYGLALVPGERDGTLGIDVLATSREIALGALRRLDGLGVRPSALGSAAEPLAEPLGVNLLAGGSMGRMRTRRHRRLRRFCLLALPLTLVVFLASLIAQGWAQGDLDAASTALERQRGAIQARAAAGNDATVAALLADKTVDGATFLFLDRLAAALPDDTFLTDLEITPERVAIKGRSANAPALVPVLEGAAGLRDVQFQSAVIREAGGGDRFDIAAARVSPPESVP